MYCNRLNVEADMKIHLLFLKRFAKIYNNAPFLLDFCFGKYGYFLKDFIILLLERGELSDKERERDISVREKHHLVAYCTHPDWR